MDAWVWIIIAVVAIAVVAAIAGGLWKAILWVWS